MWWDEWETLRRRRRSWGERRRCLSLEVEGEWTWIGSYSSYLLSSLSLLDCSTSSRTPLPSTLRLTPILNQPHQEIHQWSYKIAPPPTTALPLPLALIIFIAALQCPTRTPPAPTAATPPPKSAPAARPFDTGNSKDDHFGWLVLWFLLFFNLGFLVFQLKWLFLMFCCDKFLFL